jgi:hypothetical protein
MSLSSVRFSVIQWTDIHDLDSMFVKSKLVANDGQTDFGITSKFGFRSVRSASVALVPVRSGRATRYRFGVPTTLHGKVYPSGQLIDRLAVSVVANPVTGYFFRVHWLGVDGALIGSILSSPWDTASGTYVSHEIGGYRSGDLLALISEENMATCPNLHLFLDEDPEEVPLRQEAGYVV